jgi:glycosyltransferase involved in cell wall biosynthesis
LEKLKGHGLHLEALSLLKDLPDWVCWQVGGAQLPQEHKYLEELKRRATTLGIADRMRFIDQQSDVRRLMAAADIYCQPNTSPDSFGITFVEALHAQLPVVTTSMGGALEIIDESCGLLVRPNDARAVAEALKLLIQDRSLRQKLGGAGPDRARSLCDVGSQMLRYKNCFLRVLNDRDKKPGENPHTA